ncbi:uncharacterized protein G2W53_006161 [Senna tora]|uniref:Uncharacterized protein n=1 Tax=Senna tora TaxID=362788 RepID=A0A834X4F4_9FABA|nr:uncharacterized protein G2W53_006161 [Senna tora]
MPILPNSQRPTHMHAKPALTATEEPVYLYYYCAGVMVMIQREEEEGGRRKEAYKEMKGKGRWLRRPVGFPDGPDNDRSKAQKEYKPDLLTSSGRACP